MLDIIDYRVDITEGFHAEHEEQLHPLVARLEGTVDDEGAQGSEEDIFEDHHAHWIHFLG